MFQRMSRQHVRAALFGETCGAEFGQHGKTLVAFRFAHIRCRRAIAACRREKQQACDALWIRSSECACDDRAQRMADQHAALNT
jgi:hypothetical protein